MRQICHIEKNFLKLSQNIPFFESVAGHTRRSILPTPTRTEGRHAFAFCVIVLNFYLRAEIIGFPTSTPIRARRTVLKKLEYVLIIFSFRLLYHFSFVKSTF